MKYLETFKMFESSLNENYSNKELDDIAKKIRASLDSNDRFTMMAIPPTKIDGKMYYGIEKDDPKRFKEFKYGAYAVMEPWVELAHILNLDPDDSKTDDIIDDVVSNLRKKKLIYIEW